MPSSIFQYVTGVIAIASAVGITACVKEEKESRATAKQLQPTRGANHDDRYWCCVCGNINLQQNVGSPILEEPAAPATVTEQPARTTAMTAVTSPPDEGTSAWASD